jgi:hypothetical protein
LILAIRYVGHGFLWLSGSYAIRSIETP